MAEKFIEEIYEYAIVIDWLREYVSLVVKCDYSEARKTYNKAIKQIEKLIPAWFKFMSFFANIEVEDQGYLLKSSESGFLTLKDKFTGFFYMIFMIR